MVFVIESENLGSFGATRFSPSIHPVFIRYVWVRENGRGSRRSNCRKSCRFIRSFVTMTDLCRQTHDPQQTEVCWTFAWLKLFDIRCSNLIIKTFALKGASKRFWAWLNGYGYYKFGRI